jgi:hypothetical protein
LGITVSPDRVILTGVSYVQASFEASWTDVAVFAEVTFPDVLSVDVVTPTDVTFKSVSKPFVDGFNANIDNIVKLPQKAASDSAELTDFFTKLIIVTRTVADTLTSTDAEYRGLLKYLTDGASLADNVAFVHSKPLADSSATISFSNWHFYQTALGSPYDYTLPPPEPAYFAQNYVGGTSGEEIYATDVFLSERIYGRFPVDTVNLGDSGVLNIQNYASVTYFAEDYVGVGRTL